MSDLNTTLTDIAKRFNLNAQELIDYSNEDSIGGYHSDGAQSQWGIGSMWSVEGKVLYALVRATKPQLCVEIGTALGCSATHIATALQRNGHGKLICVDLDLTKHQIPEHLHSVIEFREGNLFEFVKEFPAADFIFEDALHIVEQVTAVWKAATQKANAGAFIVSHDSEHFVVGAWVREGIEKVVGTNYGRYLIEPGDCGLAVFRVPQSLVATMQRGEKAPIEALHDMSAEDFVQSLADDLEPGEQLIIEKPKRKPKTDQEKAEAARKQRERRAAKKVGVK